MMSVAEMKVLQFCTVCIIFNCRIKKFLAYSIVIFHLSRKVQAVAEKYKQKCKGS